MPTLQSTRNSTTVERRIRVGAHQARLTKARSLRTFYEHGQWWAEDADTGATWSVHDSEGAEGIHTFNGFCFEQVTEGEER